MSDNLSVKTILATCFQHLPTEIIFTTTTYLHSWYQILSLFGPHIHSLMIANDHLAFSLDLFSNLRTLIISSSSYGLPK
ncbi:hypothetical protein I4U23_020365 [Adineta vaga]|nr:hypothetical protein I4U23_020365 [Adineta vaga]